MSTRRRDLPPRPPETNPWRRWTIPVIGAITPVGLIVVNIAAFIVHHLASFQWIIAVLAFVSGMMLNTWAGLNVFRALRRRFPDHAAFSDRNEELLLVAGMFVVTLASVASAWFCFKGLADERELPNRLTFVTGVISIAAPVLLQGAFRRTGGPRRRAGAAVRAGAVRSVPGSETPPPAPYRVSPSVPRAEVTPPPPPSTSRGTRP